MKLSRINRWLLLILLALIAFFPKLLLSTSETNDAFIYVALSLTKLTLDLNHISPNLVDPVNGTLQYSINALDGRTASVSLLSILCRTTGLSPVELKSLPLNGIILFMLSLALAKYFLNSDFEAVAFALFISYEPIIGSLSYSVFLIGFGFSLYFTFILIHFKIIFQKKHRTIFIPLMILLFIVTYLTYYTSEFYIILGMLLISLLLFIASRFLKLKNFMNYPNMSKLVFSFIAFFITFDGMFYSYIRSKPSENICNFLLGYIYHVKELLLSQDTISSHEAIRDSTVNSFSVYLGTVLYLSLAIPILIYIFLFIFKLAKIIIKNHNYIVINPQMIIFISLFLLGVFNILLYAPLGVMGFKYILLVYPLIAFYSIKNFRLNKNLKNLLIVLILLLCIIKFCSYYSNTETGYADNYFSYMEPSAKWSASHLDHGDLLTDLETGGNLLMQMSNLLAINELSIYPFSKYNVELLNNTSTSKIDFIFKRLGYNYLLISLKYLNRPIVSFSWITPKPDSNLYKQLDNCISLYKLFSDGKGLVYRNKGG